jgi:hypothetical protein
MIIRTSFTPVRTEADLIRIHYRCLESPLKTGRIGGGSRAIKNPLFGASGQTPPKPLLGAPLLNRFWRT